MDTVVLGQVLDVLKRMGTNADAAGTTTAFARLAQIAAFVDTVETSLATDATKTGANTDAAGTTTLFALLKKLDLVVEKSLCVPFNTTNNTSFALTSSYQTIRSESGKKGYVDDFAMQFPSDASGCSVRITIDGSVVYSITSTNATGFFVFIGRRDNFISNGTTNEIAVLSPASFSTTTFSPTYEVGYGYSGSNSNAMIISLLPDSLYFKSSLLIEAKLATTTGTGKYRVYGGSY